MKNFKLLLATTAILSAGLAMNAKAANPTDDMNVSIELVVADQFEVTQHMNFGQWVVPSNASSTTFYLDFDGEIQVLSGTATRIDDDTAPYGYTVGAPCDTLSFPPTVYLAEGYNTGQQISEENASATLTNIEAVKDGETEDKGHNCRIFGKLTIPQPTSTPYHGKITITALLGLDD